MKDLPNAKLVLSGFDFILDLHNEECNSNLFWLMGMEKNVTLPHDNLRNEKYKRHFNGELDDLRQSNLVDMKLYELGEDLTRLDCEFIAQVVRGYSSRPQVRKIHFTCSHTLPLTRFSNLTLPPPRL